MADFPQTRIEIVTVESGEEAMGMLQSGEADLVELSEQEQPAAVEQGLLTELSLYLDVWEERSTLTAAAKQAVGLYGCGLCLSAARHLEPGPGLLPQRLVRGVQPGQGGGPGLLPHLGGLADAQQKLQDKGAAGWCSVGRTAWWTCSTPSCGAP